MARVPQELQQHTPTMLGVGPGDVLQDQYRIDRLLGRGGMGEVYEAFDQHLERQVAIKVLPPFLKESPRAVDSLRKEAARSIDLAHDHLARVYHFGVHEDQPFLVMEFVAGGTLAARLEAAGKLSVAEALEVLAPVAAGLDHAHGKNLVHRDLKPTNILLREADGAPVVIDFGIAAEVKDQSTKAGLTDEAQGTVGTLSYMSPEQVKGKPPAPAMDVYALAAVAYELLGGEPPFFRGDPMNVQYQILHEPPPPLEGVPEAVEEAVRQGLAKAPEDRPASAGALVEALRAAARSGAQTVVKAGVADAALAGAETVVGGVAVGAETVAGGLPVVDDAGPAVEDDGAAEAAADPVAPTPTGSAGPPPVLVVAGKLAAMRLLVDLACAWGLAAEIGDLLTSKGDPGADVLHVTLVLGAFYLPGAIAAALLAASSPALAEDPLTPHAYLLAGLTPALLVTGVAGWPFALYALVLALPVTYLHRLLAGRLRPEVFA